MNRSAKLRDAISSGSLTALTKAIGELADGLAYQLKPPYTDLRELKALEDGERYLLQFTGGLQLHYQSLQRNNEGLIFLIRFSGETLSDDPNLPTHELFYAGRVKAVTVYGYGERWPGEKLIIPPEVAMNLEVAAPNVNRVPLDALYGLLDEKEKF